MKKMLSAYALFLGILLSPALAFASPNLIFALLPASRAAVLNKTVSAYLTVINAGDITATDVSISLPHQFPASLTYQKTDPVTNEIVGTVGELATIGPGESQSYVVFITPTTAFAPQDITFVVSGSNTSATSFQPGIDTLLLSAGNSQPDIVALGSTTSNDGVVRIPKDQAPVAAFAVASINLGSAALITVSADTGPASLPLAIGVCETDPSSGSCKGPAAPTVSRQYSANEGATFGIFLQAVGSIPFVPGTNRVFVRFKDPSGATRGLTSVAVQTVRNGTLNLLVNDEDGNPASGVRVTANLLNIGNTDASGKLSLSVPAGNVLITASSDDGAAQSQISVPENGAVDIALTLGSEALVNRVSLVVTPTDSGIFDPQASQMRLSLVGVTLSGINFVKLTNDTFNIENDFTSSFATQSDGTLATTNMTALGTFLRTNYYAGPLTITVNGSDASGKLYEASADILVSVGQLRGSIQVPTSNIDLSNASVNVKIMKTEMVLTKTADSLGNFVFPLMPAGQLQVSAQVATGTVTYFAESFITFDQSMVVGLQLTTLSDFPVPGYPLTTPPPSIQTPPQPTGKQLFVQPNPDNTFAYAFTGNEDDIDGMWVDCTISPGQTTFAFTYQAETRLCESLDFYRNPHRYLDNWSVTVTTASSVLFQTGRAYVEQLKKFPMLLPQNVGQGCSTGDIPVTLSIDPNKIKRIRLTVTAQAHNPNAAFGNIYIMQSYVNAFCPQPTLNIKVEKDQIPVPQASEISLPRTAAGGGKSANDAPDFVRQMRLSYSPKDAIIDPSTVKLSILPDTGPEVQISNPLVKIDTPGSMLITTTFGNGNPDSPFSGPPPNIRKFSYKIVVPATVNGKSVTGETRTKSTYAALYQTLEQYVSKGTYSDTNYATGKNWATKCTFDWVTSNLGDLRPLNDFTKQHGGPTPPHTSHNLGESFDMYHIADLFGALQGTTQVTAPWLPSGYSKLTTPGGTYYNRLAQRAASAANSNASDHNAAIQDLTNFVNQTRAGLNQLFSDGASSVNIINGTPIGTAVKAGWAKRLILEGNDQSSGISLGLTKLPDDDVIRQRTRFNNAHNNHVHIALGAVNVGCHTQ